MPVTFNYKPLRAFMALLALIMLSFGFARPSTAGTTTYVYDELDRLHQVRFDTNNYIEYNYDEVGNLISKTPVGTIFTSPITTYILNFSAGPNGTLAGTTTQTVNANANATAVTAVPASGYQFVNWTGDNGFATTTVNPLTVATVTASQNITANFAPLPCPVRIALACYPTLQSAYAAAVNNDVIMAQAQTFNESLTANNSISVLIDGGYDTSFTSKQGSTIINGLPLISSGTVRMNNVKISTSAAIVRQLTPPSTYTLTFSAGSNGSLTGNTAQTVNAFFNAAAVTAVPAAGYQFVNWTGDNGFATTTLNPLTVTYVTTSQNITANFATASYTLNFSAGANGTLTGTASQTVNATATATAVTAVPATGYQFVNWTGTNGFVTTTSNPLTVSNVTASQNITANFALPNLPVRVSGTSPAYFSSLQDAYNAVADGATIQAQAQLYTESLAANRNISVTIIGGYTSDYSAVTGVSTMRGAPHISGGTVNLKNFRIAN